MRIKFNYLLISVPYMNIGNSPDPDLFPPKLSGPDPNFYYIIKRVRILVGSEFGFFAGSNQDPGLLTVKFGFGFSEGSDSDPGFIQDWIRIRIRKEHNTPSDQS